jgi:hypothetical protein
MSDAGAIVAALRLRKEREIAAFLKEHGALSANAAVELGAQSLIGNSALRSMIRNGAVVDTAAGTYYLNSDAYEKLRSRRRVWIAIMIALALSVALAVYLTNSAQP